MLIGETVQTTDGTYVGTGVVVTYQWRRDGVNIVGATMATYVLVAADIGPLIDCVVTLTGACGVAVADSNDLQYDYLASYALGGESPAFIFDTADALTVGADVDSIPDVSGNGNDLSAAGAANRPLYTAADAAFNNQPTAQYVSAGPEYLRDAVTVTGGTFTTYTMLMVADIQTGVLARRMIDYGNAQILLRMTAAGIVQGLMSAASSSTITSLLGSPQFVQFFGDVATTQSIGVGGVTQDTDATATTARAANLAVGFGASPSGATPADCKIAFGALLRDSIDAGVLASFAAYASYRWGVP
jgi:hypothetical protein